MKLLLDENLPKRLKNDLSEHEVYIVREKTWNGLTNGALWNGLTNGALLKNMIADDFGVLITFDKNLAYQQNFAADPIRSLSYQPSLINTSTYGRSCQKYRRFNWRKRHRRITSFNVRRFLPDKALARRRGVHVVSQDRPGAARIAEQRRVLDENDLRVGVYGS